MELCVGECCSFDRNYSAVGADMVREGEGVGSDVGADVQNGGAGWDEPLVGLNEVAFEGAKKIDREVDAFVEVELPVEATAPELAVHGAADCGASQFYAAVEDAGDGDFLTGREPDEG